MRFEEGRNIVRIVKTSAERVGERHGLWLASAVIGIPGTWAVVSAWAQVVVAQSFVEPSLVPFVALGGVASCLSAWLVWKSGRLGDKVCSVSFDQEQKVVCRGGSFVARFDEVRAVRFDREGSFDSLTLVVHRRCCFYDVVLCQESATPDDSAVFEQAAARIAEAIGVRVESRADLIAQRNSPGLKQRV